MPAPVEFLEQPALLVRQVPRNGDVDEHPVVAATAALQHGHPLAAQNADLARLGSGLELELDVALERRHRTVAPSAACVIVRSTAEMMSLPSRTNRASGRTCTMHVDVAGPAAERARMAFTAEPDPLAVVDPGRDLDLELALVVVRPVPAQSSHGVSTVARSPAVAQACVRTTWPKTELDTVWMRPSPSQAEHFTGAVPGAAPFPPQVAHETTTGNGTLRITPSAASTELDLDLGEDVGAARRPARARAHAPEEVVAEEGGEDVGEVAEVEIGRPEPARAETLVAVAVVELPRLGLRQHLVGLGRLAEPLVRLRVVGDVRVELARQPAERRT